MFKRKKKQQQAMRSRRNEFSSIRVSRLSSSAQAFQRNQTISAYKERDDEKTERQRTHELNKLRRRLLVIFVAFASIVLISLLLLSQFISEVKVELNKVANRDNLGKYEQVINGYYEANPIERFSFFLDQEKLLSHIQQSSPELSKISRIDKTGIIARATFVFDARQPVAKWVADEEEFFVDGEGRSFQVNYFDSPSLIIQDDNMTNVDHQTTIASNSFLEFVGRLITELDSQGLRITQAKVPILKTRELDVSLEGFSYYFKVAVDRSPSEQAEDIKRLVAHMSASGENPTYIDIRVKGKAYYK